MSEKMKSTILGFFIGLAVIVPGFSGAQMAIIFKLYDKLINAMDKLFTKKSILFLLPIIFGAILGFVLGLFSVKYLLEISIFAVTAVFAGMMLGSIRTVTDEVKGQVFKKRYVIYALLGLIIPILMSSVAIYTGLDFKELITNTPVYFYFVAIIIGFLIALTQLIPGLSATALLLSVGLYNALIDSISMTFWKANPQVLLVYGMIGIGGIVGILTLSKLINRCLTRYKTPFYYTIVGLCLGNIVCMFFNPEIYSFYTNMGPNGYIHIIVGVILFIVAASLMCILYLKTNKKNNVEESITRLD